MWRVVLRILNDNKPTKHMNNKLSLVLLAALLSLALIGCNKQKQDQDQTATAETEAPTYMDVDALLASADSLVGQSATVQGFCTHPCKHDAKKAFLMGSDDTKVIRAEASEEMGAFAQECINSIVTVTGQLVEDRIDEAYLQNWEEQLKAQAAKEHGEGKAGCANEKKARGEMADTPEARIADFRKQIVEREAQEGKAYLSFYHIDATSYQIEQQ